MAYAELFDGEIVSDRLVTMGHWLGRGVGPLELKNPIPIKAFENLMNGRAAVGSRRLVADAGDLKRIAAFRIILEAPPRLDNIYGVSPREAQLRIERGFAQGVNRTLRCLEDVVTGVGTMVPAPDSPKAVIALFGPFRLGIQCGKGGLPTDGTDR